MILIRHGESEWNAAYRVHKKDPEIRDAALTEEGHRQALRAAQELNGREFERILSSPLTRALQTADIIARAHRVEVVVEPLVREQFYYSCDVGTPRSALSAQWPHIDFAHLAEEWWHSEKESEEAVIRRASEFRAAMARTAHWRRVVVVTHWAFIRALSGKDAGNAELVRYDPTSPPPVLGGGLGWPASGA